MAQINTSNNIKIKINQTVVYSNHQYKGTFENEMRLWNINATDGDYADVYETNTRWRYRAQYDMWENTRQPIPYNRNLQAIDPPQDCSFSNAKLGNSERFAREDHVHKVNLDGKVATKTEFDELTSTVNDINTSVENVESKIPTQATAENQLADKAFVNSSIVNMASRYITPTAEGNEQWASLDALQKGAWYYQGESTTPTRNDYAIFLKGESVWRALYDGVQWDEQYQINSSSFTAEQLAVLNSGITQDLVNAYNVHIADRANPHNVTATQVGLGNVANERQYSKENPPDYPVESVAGKTGAVTLDVADVNNAFSKNGGVIDGNINLVKSDGTESKLQMKGKDAITYKTDGSVPEIVIGDNANPRQQIMFNSALQLRIKNGETTAYVYDSAHQPPYPVTSVDGRTGDVKLRRYETAIYNIDFRPWIYDEKLKMYYWYVYPMMDGYIGYAGCILRCFDRELDSRIYLNIDYAERFGDIILFCPFDPVGIYEELKCLIYGGYYYLD